MTDSPTTPVQVEAETGSTVVDIDWRDLTFTVSSDLDDWPVSATLALEDGNYASAIRAILGGDQFAAFMGFAPTNRDAREFFNVIATALGLGQAGE
jgi:hypothetical protein